MVGTGKTENQIVMFTRLLIYISCDVSSALETKRQRAAYPSGHWCHEGRAQNLINRHNFYAFDDTTVFGW
jgi:hypothetical protein